MTQQPPIKGGPKKSGIQAAAEFNLERFVTVQNALQGGHQDSSSNVFEQAHEEMKNGEKKGHWMWYIFPQPAVLGKSKMALRYGLNSRAEAQAYLDHDILGTRLRTMVQTAIDSGANMSRLFPSPHFSVDRCKFSACLTLFAVIDRENDVFSRALKHFQLKEHPEVLSWLCSDSTSPHHSVLAHTSPRKVAKPPESAATATVDDVEYSSSSDLSSVGEWEDLELEAIIDSRYRLNRLQYRVIWKQDRNDKRWYSARNLRQAPLKLDGFHKSHPGKDGPPVNIDIWRQYYFRGQRAPQSPDNNRSKYDATKESRADAKVTRAPAGRQQPKRLRKSMR